jgi:hypothetical protein
VVLDAFMAGFSQISCDTALRGAVPRIVSKATCDKFVRTRYNKYKMGEVFTMSRHWRTFAGDKHAPRIIGCAFVLDV